MSTKTFVTLALFALASLFVFVFWQPSSSSSSAPSVVTRSPPAIAATNPPPPLRRQPSDEPTNPVATNAPAANNDDPTPVPPPPTELRRTRDPEFDNTPLLFDAARTMSDTELLAQSAAKPRRELVLTTSTELPAVDDGDAGTTSTTTTTMAAAALVVASPAAAPQARRRNEWNGWAAAPRQAAEDWFAANFGGDWRCGVGTAAVPSLSARIVAEMTDFARKYPQNIASGSPWPSVMHVNWNDSSLLYDACAPRSIAVAAAASGDATRSLVPAAGDGSVVSLTTPALGAACFRAFTVLDRRAPTLEVALSRRCFKTTKLAPSSSSSSPFNDDADSGDKPSTALQQLQRSIAKVPAFAAPFVVGLGHSHTRYLLAMLCMSADLQWCSDFTSIQRLPFYPADVRAVFGGGVAPSFAREELLARQRELDADRLALDTASASDRVPNTAPPLKLAYVSSYYDQRHALVRLLAWLSRSKNPEDGNAVAAASYFSPIPAPAASTKSSARRTVRTSTIMSRAAPNFTSSTYGMQMALATSGDDGDDVWRITDAEAAKQKQLDADIESWARQRVLPRLKRHPTHVILSRGEWDMLYVDPDPAALTLQIESALRLVASVFRSASQQQASSAVATTTVILQLPQVHVPVATSGVGGGSRGSKSSSASHRKSVANAHWRNRCSSDARRLLLRHINMCAVHRLLRSQQSRQRDHQEEGGSLLAPRVLLFDSDRVTLSHFGATFVDATGHHYVDAALEVLALELRRIVERPAVAAEYQRLSQRLVASEGPMACSFVKNATLLFRAGQGTDTFAKCTCHRDTPLDAHFCKTTRILPRDAG